jgi:hypothetical protein
MSMERPGASFEAIEVITGGRKLVDVLDVLEERDKGAIVLLVWNDIVRSYTLTEIIEYELRLRGE